MTHQEPPVTANASVLDALFHALPGIAYVLDDRGRLLRWNRGYQRLLGIGDDALVKRSALDLVIPRDRERVARAFADALDGKEAAIECTLAWGEREVPVFGTGVRVEVDGRVLLVGTAFDLSRYLANEAAIAKSERKFREIFNATNDIIGIHSEDGRFTDVNDQFCELFQCRREDVIGRTAQFLEYSAPPYSETDALDRIRLAWDGQAQLFEWPCRRANGETFWTEVSLRRAEIGGESRIIACVRDISERKKTEVALRANEHKFRQLFDGAADALYLADQKGRFVDVNRAAAQSLGFTRDELLTMSIFDIDVDSQPKEMVHLWKAISAGTSISGERRHRHRDGTILPVDVRVSAFHDGEQLLVAAAVRSLAARRQSEREIAEWKQRYDLLTRAAGQIVYDRDASGNMVWGGAISTTLGYPVEELPRNLSDFLALVVPEDRERIGAAFARTDLRHGEYAVEYGILHRSGARLLVLDRGYPQFDDSGELVRYVGVLSDITEARRAEMERRRLEDSLRQAQKMESIGRLAGGVAHDFNNLLTAISGNLHLAMTDGVLETETRELLDEAIRAADSAAGLTRQLLTFSRKQLISPTILSVNDIVHNLEKMLRRLLGEDIHLVVQLDPGLLPVHSDVGQLEQVIVNLAVNARDAMPGGGRLSIATANVHLDGEFCRTVGPLPEGHYVRLTIEDSGIGMSNEVQEHLFEPFFTTKELGKGTGLGLAMVYGAVQQNRGYISVQSAIGSGTAIHIYLPVANGPAQSLALADNPVPTRGAETVLLVEDEEQVRTLAVRILTRQGYRVVAFGSGEEALLALTEMTAPIHLLVTDVVMPGMNGRQLADRAKQMRPSMKVLFTSGYTEDTIAHHGVLDQGIEFLAKPYSVTALLQRVRKILDASPSS
jgi:PAS domain S-box-containing protein